MGLMLAIGFLPPSLGSGLARAQEEITFPRSELVIETRIGPLAFNVELADTSKRRARGLMFREEVPDGTGMLFDFGREGPVAMWMKNTPSSLDMLFIDEAGIVRHIFEKTEPFSETVLASPVMVLAVLELAAGTVERQGIALGDKVLHPIFER